MKLTNRKPDFTQFEKVLRHEVPDRPVLFEMALSADCLKAAADPSVREDWTDFGLNDYLISAQRNLGYDYCCGSGSGFGFPVPKHAKNASIGMAHGGVVTDQKSLHALLWTRPEEYDYSRLDRVNPPEGMGVIVRSPGGILEILTALFGFEDLCYQFADEPELVEETLEMIGERMVRYFDICAAHPNVNALIHSDDWGFKTGPIISPAQLREYIIPWHKKVVEICHRHGKPVILHSCGKLDAVWEDIIELGYDAKHSFEDGATSIEDSLRRWGDRMPLLGGIDLDFLCRQTPDEIYARARALLDQTAEKGGYALGSGNSIPDYIPLEKFFAMNRAALDYK
jgi:uroporphyrinogen decarboxylase